MEALEKALQENIVQLRKKVEEEREIQLREHEKMLAHKLKVSLYGPWSVNKGQYPVSSRREVQKF